MESSRSLSDLHRLFHEGFQDLGVTVALVVGRVTAEEVEVLAALHVPHVDALSASQCNRQRLVVVRAVLQVQVDVILVGVRCRDTAAVAV